jgi:hypothetical protein
MSVKQERIFHYNQITLNIQMNEDDDDEVTQCVLSPSYSRVFCDTDISEINADEPGKFKSFYRKKIVAKIVTICLLKHNVKYTFFFRWISPVAFQLQQQNPQ